MRFMVMVKATKTSETQKLPIDPALVADMGKFNEALIKAGVMLAGDGLRPSRDGARVKFSADDKRTVVDGPFAETKELVAGFWLWKCDSLQDAIAWAKKSPSPFPGEDCEVEIRQLYEEEDFK
jgi:hypothetical protein